MTPGPGRGVLGGAALSLAAVLLLLLFCQDAQAAFVKRYSTIANGAVTFTGNTLGLSKQTDANAPGTAHSIGTFITTDTTVRDGTSWYYGTTSDWRKDLSAAVLTLPAGSTVLYAELIWGGSYNYGGENVSSSLGTSVSFKTPVGTFSVGPALSTAVTLTGENYYVRSADVTAIVQSGGAGTYTVGGVPGTQGNSENAANACGWTLAVIYANAGLPARNMTVFVGGELTNSSVQTVSTVSGFCTPQAGAISARLLVSVIEGDSVLTGDQMLFGPTTATMAAISGTNNPLSNFFCSQINKDNGTLDTSGTFGTRNHPLGSNGTGNRQGWDITNVDVSARMQNGQSTANTKGTTTGDRYIINAVALQINVGAPTFPTAVMQVDKASTYVGDTLTYTVRLDNTTGSANAVNVLFTDNLPAGTSFVAGTFTVNGAARPTENPTLGVSLGTVAAGTQMTVSYKALVNAVPLPPAPAEFDGHSSWTYQYQSCPGFPTNNGTLSTNTVVTGVPRLEVTKSASPSGKVYPGNTVIYTMTMKNSGTATTSGTTLADPIPSGTQYVAGSTKLNGAVMADVGGAMPYAATRLVNGPGDAAGIISAGNTSTVSFSVVIGNNPPLIITNTATVDPDGAGPAPPIVVSITNPPVEADLGVAITNNKASLVAGSPVTYVVTVANNGPDSVIGFTLSVPLPESIKTPAYTASAGSYDVNTGIWSGLNLAMGQSVTLTIVATVSPTATGTVAVTATVAVFPGVKDANTANNTASDTDPVTRSADLSITKTDGLDFVQPGASVAYLITVNNAGPSAVSEINVTDTIPSLLLTPVFTPSQGVYNEQTGLWTGLSLAPGGNVTLQLVGMASPDGNGELVNSVTVTPPTGVTDPNPANNTATDKDIFGLGPLMKLEKSADKSNAAPGETVTFTLHYRNTGDAPATTLIITDQVPAFTAYIPQSMRLGPASATYQTATPKTDEADDDEATVSAGAIIVIIPSVLANDGVPGSGQDEGKVFFRVLVD